MGTAQRPDPTEAVRRQLRPLFDQDVIKEVDEERLLVESAALERD